jgi:hypothetical protein
VQVNCNIQLQHIYLLKLTTWLTQFTSYQAANNLPRHRDAAVVALNVQGSSAKALHWAKDVLSGGGCVADAAADCWMSMLKDAGISR